SNCFVLGKIKNDVTISIKPTVTFNKFDISSCKFETSNDISTYFALHKQYSLKRLRDFTPYWQNTFAMITGDVSYISPEILDVEKELGIYHLLAVSSSHVVVIAAIFYFFLNRFNVPKFTTQFLIIFTLFLFAYYTNFAPSALRAILCMTFVILLPKKFYTSLIDILSIVFILLCISSPNIIFDIGFQFSFLITFFILISSPILKSLKSIQSVLAITFISQVSSFVISAYYFNQIQWIGFFSNLLFIPYYSLILFPLAIFTYLYIQLFTTNHFLISLINFFYSLHDQYLIKMFKYFEQLRWFIGELNHVYVTYMVIWIIIIIALFTNNFIKSSIIIFIIGSILITKLTTQPQT
ncbi:DNA internalization-related competence protein ComEC/Rec2, partial [Staphylococcus carnosus]